MASIIKYNLQSLEQFFNDIAEPDHITGHLEMLLQFLVYYGDKEKVHGLYNIYCDMLEFKKVLQEITRE